jgi:hypothetical protein
MSYNITWQAANDQALLERITAATAEQAWRNPAVFDSEYAERVRQGPQAANTEMVWAVATASDVNAAYESAVVSGNPNPGGDEAVITDAMILGIIQADWPDDVAP